MTTIISRLYSDSATAGSVASALKAAGLAPGDVDVIARDDAASPAELISRIEATRVNPASAAAYASVATGGSALVVVRAPFIPFGLARKAIDIVNASPSMDAGIANQNEYIRGELAPESGLSILPDSPRFLSADMDPGLNHRTRPVSAAFGLPLLSKDRERDSVLHGEPFMTAKFYHLLSSRKPKKDILIEGGGPVFSRQFGWPLLYPRE